MSPKLLVLSGKDMIKVLIKSGFEISRVNGSHHMLRNKEGRTTVVPVHGNEVLGRGLIRKILNDTNLNPEDLF